MTLTLLSVYSSAQVLAVYDFEQVTSSSGTLDPTPPPAVAGITFSPFRYSGPAANPAANGRFAFKNWPAGATNGVNTYSTFTGVLSPTVYFEVSLTPAPSYTVSLSSITFSMRRSGTGIRNYAVRFSLDDFSMNLPASVTGNTRIAVINPDVYFWKNDAQNISSEQKGNTTTFFAASLNSFTHAVTFRFYGWNAESSSGLFSLDNVTFNGTATNTVVIEPPPTPSVTTGMNEEELPDGLVIFPNPVVKGELKIRATEPFDRIRLYDLQGRLVWERNCLITKQILIPLDEPSGTYWLYLYSGRKVRRRQVMIAE